MERLKQQMDFILEIDKVKNIIRQSYLTDGKRKENDAEHSWHIAVMAVILKEYVKEEIDFLKVITMVLIHDLVEIDAGDTYAYDSTGASTKKERETNAADRIFEIIPDDQKEYFRGLWDEFEEYTTDEAMYAHLLDNLEPIMLNDASGGKSWLEHGVKKSQIYKRNEKVKDISSDIWNFMQDIIERNVKKGNIADR